MTKFAQRIRQFTAPVIEATLLVSAGGGAAHAEPSSQPDFELQLGKDPTGKPTLLIAVGKCVGYWHAPTEVNGKMEWGAESHCSGSGWIPHQLSLVLQQKEVIDWWFDAFHSVAWSDSASYQFGWPDISLHEHWWSCEDFASTDYRIVAEVTAVSHNKAIISPEYTVDCVYDNNLDTSRKAPQR